MSTKESWSQVLRGHTHYAMGMQPTSAAGLVNLATTVASTL